MGGGGGCHPETGRERPTQRPARYHPTGTWRQVVLEETEYKACFLFTTDLKGGGPASGGAVSLSSLTHSLTCVDFTRLVLTAWVNPSISCGGRVFT